MSEDPCHKQTEDLRSAILEWVNASEATRRFIVTKPWAISDDHDTFSPDYFRAMQKAFEKERIARERYTQANKALYDCKERHGLID